MKKTHRHFDGECQKMVDETCRHIVRTGKFPEKKVARIIVRMLVRTAIEKGLREMGIPMLDSARADFNQSLHGSDVPEKW